MHVFHSLTAKLVAAVLALVAFAFTADLLLSASISDRINRKTEELTAQMRGVVADKENNPRNQGRSKYGVKRPKK